MKNIIAIIILVVSVVLISIKTDAKIPTHNEVYVGLMEISLDGTFTSPTVEMVDVDNYTYQEYSNGTCMVTTEASTKHLYKQLKSNPDFFREYPNFKIRPVCKRK